MKKIILAILLSSSVSFANRESGGRYAATAVYVYFQSYGTGIDSETKQQFENLVSEAKSKGLVSDETQELKGREGETLNCVHLLSALDRNSLIRNLAPSIIADTQAEGIQRTRVYVGADCHSFEKATEQQIK